MHDTSAGAWRQLLDTPPGRPFLCDAAIVSVMVPIDCEGLGELLHFVNERAREARLRVELPSDEDVRPEVLDACDLRLAQAVRGLPAVSAGLSLQAMHLRERWGILRYEAVTEGHVLLPRTAEACGEKGLRCIQDYDC